MNILNMILLTSLIFVTSCNPQSDSTLPGLTDLVNEEYAFAQSSLQNGIRTAFLTYLSDNAVIFRPNIINGKKWYENYSFSKKVLYWKPIFSDISISGELGYTTGPWEYYKGDNPDTAIAFGHYVSLWQKESDGNWKVIIDVGISHQSSESISLKNIEMKDIEHPARIIYNQNQNVGRNNSALLETEIQFSKISRSEGFPKAFLTYACEDVRLYRNEYLPIVGKVEALEFLKVIKNPSTWNPHVAEVSLGGDLGYTYGVLEKMNNKSDDSTIERCAYLRIWKKKPNDKWQLVLDITNPLPNSNDAQN